MWIIWTITIPIWLICLVVFMGYAVFDAYGKIVVGFFNIVFFIIFLFSILAVVVLSGDLYRGITKKDRNVDISDDLKCLLVVGVYAFFYGSWFIKNYLI